MGKFKSLQTQTCTASRFLIYPETHVYGDANCSPSRTFFCPLTSAAGPGTSVTLPPAATIFSRACLLNRCAETDSDFDGVPDVDDPDP
ncbi:uncharacterized protein METZ01_LOCUS428508, partial [marine metagenome]